MGSLYDNMIYEVMQRDGYCRGCDAILRRNKDFAIKMYSHRNRGQNILLCSLCVTKAFNCVQDIEGSDG